MHRVVLALLVPSLALAILAAMFVVGRETTVNDMNKLAKLVRVANGVNDLVHELQRERGISAVFLGSKGSQLQQELLKQRELTNQKRQELEATLQRLDASAIGDALGKNLKDALGRVQRLGDMRRYIDGLKIPPVASNAYFTSTDMQLLVVDDEIAELVTNPEVARPLSAYVRFVQAEERAGEERAVGAPGFAAGKFDLTQYGRFTAAVADENTHFSLFDSSASPEERAFVTATVTGEAVSEVVRMRNTVLEVGPGGSLGDINGAYWYKMQTARIDLMKKVEDYLATRLLSSANDVRAQAVSGFWTALAGTGAALLATALLGFVIIRGITRPITGMTNAMTGLADGNLEVEVPGVGRHDEIGAMAASVLVFKGNMIEANRLRAEQDALKQQAEAEKRAAMHKMADDFEAGVKGVVALVASASAELRGTAQSLSGTAEETQRQSTSVAAASEQASMNVTTVASAAEEMSASIGEIARQVAVSADIGAQAVQDADRANTRVQALVEAAQKIGDVVKLISDITAQTNLLALNATIEAARAGEAGKGFAVVASEVKTLANQTAKATEEIAEQIRMIQTATGDSVKAIEEIGLTIGRVSEIATSISAAIEQQGAATKEIAANVQQASAGTRVVSANIVSINQATAETGAAASQVLSAATELSQHSATLHAHVDDFIATIRAA
jgi:methyl-accepting chemotaxis protein